MTRAMLTPRQEAILLRVRRRNIAADGAESGQEMAEALWRGGLFTLTEQGQRAATQLANKGLIMPLGSTPTGATTWDVTQAGRDWQKEWLT